MFAHNNNNSDNNTTTQLSLKGRTTDSNAVDNNGVSETKTPSFISSKDAN